MSDVRYARAGDAHVAYRFVVGGRSGAGHDIVMMGGGTASMESYGDDPVGARLMEGLASLGRLVMVDRRGVGLSDPLPPDARDLSEVWSQDLAAVIRASEVREPVVFLTNLGLDLAGRVAGTPGFGAGLVVFEPLPLRVDTPALRAAARTLMASIRGEADWLEVVCPSRAGDATFRAWYDRAGRAGASPSVAARLYELPAEATATEVERIAAAATMPVLLLRRPGNAISAPADGDAGLTLLPTAVRVDLPGDDLLVFGEESEALVAEVARFVTGEDHQASVSRALAAVMFTDLAASTERAAEAGDTRWTRTLDAHDDAVRKAVRRHGGRVVKTTGDGVLATFPSASGAMHAGMQIRAALAANGLAVRIGVHVGDVERRGDDVAGVAVHVAARVTNLAQPGELLVSESARMAASGDSFAFEDRGRHRLKGLSGEFVLSACREHSSS